MSPGKQIETKQNKKIFRRLLNDAYLGGDMRVVDELVAPDYINYSDNLHGIEEYKQYIQRFRSAIPDLRMVVLKQTARRNRVVTRWFAAGRHCGELMGIPPSGNKVIINIKSTARVINGQIVAEWCDSFSIGNLRNFNFLLNQG